jgi:DNA-binding transcriptional LysR family regulator
MSFKTDQLRYFVTVAEEGQITRAAKKLFIAQPALSQAISQLEAELGLKLLERHAKGVRLTPSGEAFLEKARAVVKTELDVGLTAQSLARAARGVLEVGFVGPPPPMSQPGLFAAFAAAHPEAEVAFRELPFPHGETQAWLERVDVALCHAPAREDGIELCPVRVEPRAVLAPSDHRLARSTEARVEDVIDETFISYHPTVQPEWAGFHSLDDHRGGPPAAITSDRVTTSLEMLGRLATGPALTTLPESDARLVENALTNVVAIPLSDAAPASVSLIWHASDARPLVASLVEMAAVRAAQA